MFTIPKPQLPGRTGPVVAVAMAAGALAAASPSAALPPDPGAHPSELRSYVEERAAQCAATGGSLIIGDYATEAEFNGDGRPDYIVNEGGLYCPREGHSAYCGSAGCGLRILVSTAQGLRTVYQVSLQGYVLTRLADGRQGIAYGAHGTFCGNRTGADTCFGVMSWDGRKWATRAVRKEPPELAARARLEEAGPPKPNGTWIAKPLPGGGSMAVLEGASGFPKLAAACTDVGATAIFKDTMAHFAGGPVAVSLIGYEDLDFDRPRVSPNLALQPVPGEPPSHLGRISPQVQARLLALAADAQPVGQILWTTNGGRYWLSAELSLVNYAASVGPALARCRGVSPRRR